MQSSPQTDRKVEERTKGNALYLPVKQGKWKILDGQYVDLKANRPI